MARVIAKHRHGLAIELHQRAQLATIMKLIDINNHSRAKSEHIGLAVNLSLQCRAVSIFDTRCRVQTDPMQHINQIVVGGDVLQAAGNQQDLDYAHMPGARLGPAEDPVAPSHGDDPKGTFEVVGRDGYVEIACKDPQGSVALGHIEQRIGEGIVVK